MLLGGRGGELGAGTPDVVVQWQGGRAPNVHSTLPPDPSAGVKHISLSRAAITHTEQQRQDQFVVAKSSS